MLPARRWTLRQHVAAAITILLLAVAGCGSAEGDGAEEAAAQNEGVVVDQVRAQDLVGTLYTPDSGSTQRPPILLLGGSEGGAPERAAKAYARDGWQTLALAYFGERGLPTDLANVPLEYFRRAIGWLHQRSGSTLPPVVIGNSRGSEPALLLAAHAPHLLSGVVAAAPSNVVVCGYPDVSRPAWTRNGKALPCVDEFDVGYTINNPDAEIPVQQVRVPTLLVCGGVDQVWPACAMARLMAREMKHASVVEIDNGGHLVGIPPSVDVAAELLHRVRDDPETSETTRAKAWREVKEFLGRIARR